MQLSAVITKSDLAELLDSMLPLRIDLGGGGRRSVLFGRAQSVELVAGTGVRLSGDARLTWEMAGLSVPATVRAWRLLLVPSVKMDRDAWLLAFEPKLEELEIRNVPGFVDDRIVEAVNDGLAAQRGRLVWNFSKTLSWHRVLPARFSPPGRFDLEPQKGEATVTDEALRLEVTMRGRVTMTRIQESAREEEPASLLPLQPAFARR